MTDKRYTNLDTTNHNIRVRSLIPQWRTLGMQQHNLKTRPSFQLEYSPRSRRYRITALTPGISMI